MSFIEDVTRGNRAEFTPIMDNQHRRVCDGCGRSTPVFEEWASPLCPLCEAVWRAGLYKPTVIYMPKFGRGRKAASASLLVN